MIRRTMVRPLGDKNTSPIDTPLSDGVNRFQNGERIDT